MDEARIERLANLMAACHDKEAEAVARRRIARCRRRNEADWSLVWQEVAIRLSEKTTSGAVAKVGSGGVTDALRPRELDVDRFVEGIK